MRTRAFRNKWLRVSVAIAWLTIGIGLARPGEGDKKPVGRVISGQGKRIPHAFEGQLASGPLTAIEGTGFGIQASPPKGGGGACSITEFCNPELFCHGGTNSTCVVESFVGGQQWRVCLYATTFGTPDHQGSKGIAIGPVDFKANADSPWRPIIYKAGVAEIFTPYHEGTTRIFDTQYADWTNWRQSVSAADAGENGVLLTLPQDSDLGPSIVAECRDRGVAWLCKGAFGDRVRRGQELVLWGIFDAGNYDFITEYGFRDDGTITFRLGATGFNLPQMPTESHMHDVLWRVDIDLNGPRFDTALSTSHEEGLFQQPLVAFDTQFPFGPPANLFATEGFADWDPLRFTTLLIEDHGTTNANGNSRGYEVSDSRPGTARHFDSQDNWTQHDFWVTRWHANEDDAWAFPWKPPDQYLFPFIADNEGTANTDLVLWHLTSTHHDPIDEDRHSPSEYGVTLVHWTGFELKPHNFFDVNPLGAPAPCDQ